MAASPKLKNELRQADILFPAGSASLLPHNIYMPENHMENLYNSKNSLVRFVHRSKLKKIMGVIRYEQGKLKDIARLLDAGCGEGHLLEEIHKIRPDFKLFGIDATQVAAEKAKERNPGAEIVCDDLLNLNKHFKDRFFDIVICSEVLEHIPRMSRPLPILKGA